MAGIMSENFGLRCSLAGHDREIRSVAALSQPDGAFVSICTERIVVWTPEKDGIGFHEDSVIRCQCNAVHSLCVVAPNDEYPSGLILVGTDEPSIHAYVAPSNEPIYTLKEHSDIVCSLAVGRFGTVVSGSWDKTAKVWYKQKCTMTLIGHEGAVLSILLMPVGGYMLTGSADSTIKRWRAGKCELTFEGHTDWVRALCVLTQSEFLSCGNDGTVRRWNISGGCLQTYTGHSGAVLGIACLPDGKGFVSVGEDGKMSVWKDETQVQMTLSQQSLSSVCVLCNGDIVTGASDNLIRVFTTDPERIAAGVSPERPDPVHLETTSTEMKEIESTSADKASSPGEEILPRSELSSNGPKSATEDCATKSELPESQASGRDESSTTSSSAESEKSKAEATEKSKAEATEKSNAEATEKSKAEATEKCETGATEKTKAEAIDKSKAKSTGITISTSSSEAQKPSSRKAVFEGKEYDFVFDVELGEGAPALKLPYNRTEKPEVAAQAFLDRNALNRKFLTNVIDFIRKEAGLASGVEKPKQKGSDSSVGQQVATRKAGEYFPETSYIMFENLNKKGVFTKLRDFNYETSEENQLNKAEMEYLDLLVSGLKGEAPAGVFPALWKLLSWPKPDLLFPALDILRFTMLNKYVNAYMCTSEDGKRFIDYISSILSTSSTSPRNQFLVLRALCNTFQHAYGEHLMLSSYDRLATDFLNFKSDSEPQLQIAQSSLLLNFVIAFCRAKDTDGKMRCLSGAVTLSQSLTDPEAYFRLLVAIGTAVVDDRACYKLARTLDLQNFFNMCCCEDLEKVRCAAESVTKRVA